MQNDSFREIMSLHKPTNEGGVVGKWEMKF